MKLFNFIEVSIFNETRKVCINVTQIVKVKALARAQEGVGLDV